MRHYSVSLRSSVALLAFAGAVFGPGAVGAEEIFPGATFGDRSGAIVVADVDGNGVPDVVFVSGTAENVPTGEVAVLLGTGDGTFADERRFPTGDRSGSAMAVGDLDGNGTPDLVVARPLSGSSVSVLLGNGDGTFAQRQGVATAGSPRAVAIADFDGDGTSDLAISSFENFDEPGYVSVWLGNGDGTFAAERRSAVGELPGSVAVGDLDGNGTPDLAVANSLAGDVSVLLGNGDGTFVPEQRVAVGDSPSSVAMADFDGNGTLDLAAANLGSCDVSVLLGNGDGTFAAERRIAVAGDPLLVAIADLDGDDIADLVVGIRDLNGPEVVAVALGDGGGTFSSPRHFLSNGYDFSVADLDGNGTADLAVSTPGSGGISVLLGRGDGSLESPRGLAVGGRPRSVAIADFDGDGTSDLAVSTDENFDEPGDVSVSLGNGDGTFAPEQRFAVGESPGSVAVGDLDGNGTPDLAVANSMSDDVSVLLGNGDGTFAPEQRFAVGDSPSSVAMADFDGNGTLDLAAANSGSRAVSVLPGNGDGTFAPRRTFAIDGIPGPVAIADFDGNGTPDVAVPDWASANVSVLLGNGDGTFAPERRLPVVGIPGLETFPQAIAVGDFDGNGAPDLAVANYEIGDVSVGDAASVSVLLGDGQGSFAQHPTLGLTVGPIWPYVFPTSVAVGDLDGDGIEDLVVLVSGNRGEATVVLGNGDGSFAGNHRFTLGTAPTSAALGDFDENGTQDLATAAFRSVSVLLNQSPAIRCAELGDNTTIGQLDVDVFSFGGEEGDRVRVGLEASVAEAGRATLLVMAGGEGAVDTVWSDRGALPNELTVALPGGGEFFIGVAEQPAALLLRGESYRGPYCVTADVAPGAAPALRATTSVEGAERAVAVTDEAVVSSGPRRDRRSTARDGGVPRAPGFVRRASGRRLVRGTASSGLEAGGSAPSETVSPSVVDRVRRANGPEQTRTRSEEGSSDDR